MKKNFCSYIKCVRRSSSTLVNLKENGAESFYCNHMLITSGKPHNKQDGLRPTDETNDLLPESPENMNIDYCIYITSGGMIRKYSHKDTVYMKNIHIYVEPLTLIAAFEKHKKEEHG